MLFIFIVALLLIGCIFLIKKTSIAISLQVDSKNHEKIPIQGRFMRLLIPALLGVVSTALIFAIIYYFYFLQPTNEIILEAREIMKGNQITDENDPLHRYNLPEEYFPMVEKSSVSINRKFTWNDGKYGFIKIRYSLTYYDDNGNDIERNLGIDSIWIIKKVQEEWKVIQIIENP